MRASEGTSLLPAPPLPYCERAFVAANSAPAHMPKHKPVPAKAQPAPSSAANPPKLIPVSKGDGACQTGARVTDRERRNGVVVEANGSDCRVKLDDGTIRDSLAWMLKSGDTAPQESNGDGEVTTAGRRRASQAHLTWRLRVAPLMPARANREAIPTTPVPIRFPFNLGLGQAFTVSVWNLERLAFHLGPVVFTTPPAM